MKASTLLAVVLHGVVGLGANAQVAQTPGSPAEWRRFMTESPIAGFEDDFLSFTKDEPVEAEKRGMLIDLDEALGQNATISSDRFTLYSDVLLADHDSRVDVFIPPVTGIYTRLISSPGEEAHIYVHRLGESATTRHVFYLVAPQVQQPVFVHLADTALVDIPLPVIFDVEGDDKPASIGIMITFHGSRITPVIKYLYESDLPRGELMSETFAASLSAQVLASTALQWQYPHVAIRMASYVQLMSAGSQRTKYIYMRAQSIKDWLTSTLSAGAHFVPALGVDVWEKSVDSILGVAQFFEEQYDVLTDRETDIEDKLLAWNESLAQARAYVKQQEIDVLSQEGSYETALSVLVRVETDFDAQSVRLAAAGAKYQAGLEAYLEHQDRMAIFDMVTRLLYIAICMRLAYTSDKAFMSLGGGLDAMAFTPLQLVPIWNDFGEVLGGNDDLFHQLLDDAFNKTDSVIEVTLNEVSELARGEPEEADVARSASAIRALTERTKVSKLMIALTQQLQLASKDTADIIPIQSSYLPTEGEMTVLWDDYLLENTWWCDRVIDLGIDGAGDLMLETNKLVSRGKLMATAQAQAIKSGRDLISARLDLHQARQQVDRLQEILADFETSLELSQEARVAFNDRRMNIRADLVRTMDKMRQSYSFLALKDSAVTLDPTQSLDALALAKGSISDDVLDFEDNWTGEPQGVCGRPIYASEAGNQGIELIESIRSSVNHTGIFAIQPENTPGGFSGPFTGGQHFLVNNLKVYLRGVRAKSGGSRVDVKLGITTTGVYQNVRLAEGSGSEYVVRDFVMSPHDGIVDYTWNLETDSIVSMPTWPVWKGDKWLAPTPFTQWVIMPHHAELLDFSNMTDVVLVFGYSAYLDSNPLSRVGAGDEVFMDCDRRPPA